MTEVEVRVARPDEWQSAGDLAGRAYRSNGSEESYPEVVRASVAAPVEPDHLLVALRDGILVGTATLCPPGTRHAELGNPGEMEFRFLSVAAEARGTGVAEALVQEVEVRARSAGAESLVCCVMDGNEPAHRLYRRMGFERVPERDWWPIPEVELLAYCKPL